MALPDAQLFAKQSRFVSGVAVLAALGGLLFGYLDEVRLRHDLCAGGDRLGVRADAHHAVHGPLRPRPGIGQGGTFWMYAFFGLCALAFFDRKVPETKERSLEEIERVIRGEDAAASSAEAV